MTVDTPFGSPDPIDVMLELAGRIAALPADPDRRMGGILVGLFSDAVETQLTPLHRRIGELVARLDDLEANATDLPRLIDRLGDRGELVLRRRLDAGGR